MFAKAMHRAPDLATQGEILARVAALFDAGTLTSTRTPDARPRTPAALAEAHRRLASGTVIGELALRGLTGPKGQVRAG